jgi:hypothetical protein
VGERTAIIVEISRNSEVGRGSPEGQMAEYHGGKTTRKILPVKMPLN